ncbi:MAG: ATP-binding protein [Vulcanisaeta sp.]|nr:ATP-binding protein [Vulcanisaeta sp.]
MCWGRVFGFGDSICVGVRNCYHALGASAYSRFLSAVKSLVPDSSVVKARGETFICFPQGVDAEAVLSKALELARGGFALDYVVVDWRAVYELASRRVAPIPSLVPILREAVVNLDAGNNVALVGPPGSGKTFIMQSLEEAVKALGLSALYINATSMTKAALENALLMNQSLALVLIDELDKALSREAQVLLQLLDEYGVVKILKSNGGEVRTSARVVLGLNTTALRRKALNVWAPLLDRAVIIEVPRPSKDELLALFTEESGGAPREVLSTVAAALSQRDVSIRKVMQAARYVKTALEWGIPMEDIKKQVMRILTTT